MLAAASLVLLMTPALAFFYGGMTRSKTVLNMMMMSFGALAVVGPIWMLWGYSETFGTNIAGIIGDPFEFFALHNLTDDGSLMAATGVPATVAVGYQATFAIITVALISGAIADRAKFGTWLVFSGIWVTLVYSPIAHMVWGGGALSGGGNSIAEWLSTPIDFAGGTVVHINAGMAGFMLCLIIGKRKGFAKDPMKPHNLPFVMLGAALLWFGWFGFNAGSEFGADGIAGQAWINTLTATCVAALGWLIVERIRDHHATSLGAASGVVAGLVAITPAAGCGRHRRRHVHRPHRRCALRPGRRSEVQVRLRRLARRRRCPPRRRHRRHRPDRLLRQRSARRRGRRHLVHLGTGRRAERSVLRWRLHPAVAPRSWSP